MSNQPAHGVGARPNPERAELARAITSPATLEVVAQAVAEASESMQLVYVERRGALLRWSPAHRGGPYPLLRITARFLEMDYHALVVPCRPLNVDHAGFGRDGVWEGVCVVGTKEDESDLPDAWCLLEFDGVVPAADVKARIVETLAGSIFENEET